MNIARTAPADGRCANCGTDLLGRWCHLCGQRAADHHRSLRHLVGETVEGMTHADGRLWRTLRLLVMNPARLTRDYVGGHRAAEIPPLRMFFVTLLVVFAAAPLSLHGRVLTMSPAENSTAKQAVAGFNIADHPRLTQWLRDHADRALDTPDQMIYGMRDRAERFAFMLLPLSALVLRLLFPLRRDVGLYDHMIFTMHSLSFAGLYWVVCGAAEWVIDTRLVYALLLFSGLSVHLFMHMRGFYRIGRFGTLARMAVLSVMTMGIFALLLAGLAALSFSMLSAR